MLMGTPSGRKFPILLPFRNGARKNKKFTQINLMNFSSFLYVGALLAAFCLASFQTAFAQNASVPLIDTKIWETHRDSVQHPAATIKAADIANARENIARYDWAREYSQAREKSVAGVLPTLTPAYLEQMIPETTPGDILFTPCPACRDLGKPRLDHGDWQWNARDPEHLKCKVCDTVFPNEKYPENVVLKTTWGKPQTLTFYGGEPFPIFSYKTGRPSFSGNIRAQKVNYMVNLCHNLAEAYALSGKEEYAQGVRLILLRLSETYPFWLIHAGYGEYADMDPKIAAASLTKLPEDELVYPPNVPDRTLHTGYWSAGRARGVGMEGIFMRDVAEAYDLTASAKTADGKPLYSEAEKKQIERDLLLESAYLAVGDPSLNNKSITNSSGAAIVGLAIGHPELVHFGLDGWMKTVNDWFLPDGSTSESPAYAQMTLGGMIYFAQAFRGYSDPPGYKAGDGQRLENFDLYHGTKYEKVMQMLYDTLQGDLKYPPFADSYPKTGVYAPFVELMAANYPQRPQYLSLLKEIAGEDLSKGYAPIAIWYREPGSEERSTPALTLPDILPPSLKIGHMREGENGRRGLLLLSASDWGGHHHYDSLNLYYWKNGEELLSDLGYLWDHPEKEKTYRTLAHNTVLLDEKNQVSKDRGGDVLFFKTQNNIKAMSASSTAYPDASVYQRTSALVDHGANGSYAIDFFRVQGGAKQDFVFHGPNNDFQVEGLAFAPQSEALYDFKNVRTAAANATWKLNWKLNPTLDFTAWNISASGEQAFIGDGWGQRDSKNKDLGATLPYIVRRTNGDALHTFVSLFEGHAPSEPLVRGVRRLEVADADVVALEIETRLGRDYIVSQRAPRAVSVTTPMGVLPVQGALTIVSIENGKIARTWSESDAPVKFSVTK
jgi:hypothetical protein